MVKYKIKGAKVKDVVKIPQAMLEKRRTTHYDRLLKDALKGPKKIVAETEDRAKNVYLVIRQKIKKDKLKLEAARTRAEIYVWPLKKKSKA